MSDDGTQQNQGDLTDYPESESDFSPEERREVLAEIDAEAQKNRIQVTPDLLRVESGRSGALLPVLVNLVGVFVLVAGLGIGWYLSQRSEAQRSGETGTFKTAEGRLIAVLRRETDQQLQAKDNEIEAMQSRLTDVSQERDQILEEIDDRLRVREEELRQALVQELQEERQRLLAAGQTRSQVDTQLSTLEAEREQQIAAEIEDYRKGLEEEWELQLSGLKVVQAEYENALSSLEKDRITITAESRAREQALREEAEKQSAARELAAQTEEAQQAAAEAQQALKALSDQVEQEALVQSQINGLYSRIADDVGSLDYGAALAKIQQIRELYEDPRFLALPGIQKRVKIDTFLTNSLVRLIEEQRQSSEIDLASLTAAAGAIAEIRGVVTQARALAGAGQTAEAAERYRRALSVLPEASEAYGYLEQRQTEAVELRVAAFGVARADANRAFAGGDYTTALEGYATALIVGAGSQIPAQDVLQQIETASDRLSEQSSQAAVEEARIAFQGQLAREIQAAQATTREEMETEFEDRLIALRQDQRAAEAEAAEAADPGMSVESEARTSTQTVSSPQAVAMLGTADAYMTQRRYPDALDTYLGLIRAYPESLEVSSAATGVASAARALVERNESEVEGLRTTIDSLESAVQRLGPFEQRETGLRQRYSDYAAEEDRILGEQGERGLATAQLALQAFLTAQQTSDLMPGLWNRTQRYQNAFEREGRQIPILETIDIVYNLSGADTREDKLDFLAVEAQRYSDNEFLVQFIEELRLLVEEG